MSSARVALLTKPPGSGASQRIANAIQKGIVAMAASVWSVVARGRPREAEEGGRRNRDCREHDQALERARGEEQPRFAQALKAQARAD